MAKQGQGPTTVRKENGFLSLFNISLGISKKVAEMPYWHIDLNAGSGFNEDVGCDGSPIIFLRAAAEVQRPVRAYFCDNDEASVSSLRERLATLDLPDNVEYVCEVSDNVEFLPRVAADIRRALGREQFAIGTCLCDPNGCNHIPLDSIVGFFREFPRIDFILNVNCNVFRCIPGCRRSTRLPSSTVEAFKIKSSLPEIVEMIRKKHWLIRAPMGRPGRQMFTILAGYNLSNAPNRFQDFFDVTSPKGEEILRRLNKIDPDQQYFSFMEE
jgi:hypothetical protein